MYEYKDLNLEPIASDAIALPLSYIRLTEDVLDKWARNLLGYMIPHTLVSFRWYYSPSSYVDERARPLLALRAVHPWLPTSDYYG